MQKLKQENLYKNDLIPINGKLVERYNKCLLKLGFEPTKLTSFYIDGIGWSPEIAEEKNNPFYLNNGESNPHCIVISPLQNGVTLYNPTHTFEKEIMKLVFKTYAVKIQNITRDSAICIDFDQKIDVFYSPLDVLKYKEVIVRFHLIDNLKKAKEEQLQLIEKFNEGTNFIDETIHQNLLISAKKYGDLRTRDIDLDDLIYQTNSFYINAFGGIYVLRDFISPILIFEDKNTYEEAFSKKPYNHFFYHISQPELIAKLNSHLIVECDLEKVLTTKKYQRVKKYIFSSFLKNTTHPIKEILNDTILFKSYLNKIDLESRKKVMGAELYLEEHKITHRFKTYNNQQSQHIDNDLYIALHKPHSSLKASHQDLIWKLLVSISPNDVLFLYWYDKELFYKKYKTWNPSLQDWVIEVIKNEFKNY